MDATLRFIDYRPGDLVTDSTTVRPGAKTESLKLASSQVVTAFSGADPAVERNHEGRLVPALPGMRCGHCGKPLFAHDSMTRKFTWDDADVRGCHCPRHPVGDGSDGGPIILRHLDERAVIAAEQQVVETKRLADLLACYLTQNGVALPATSSDKTQSVATSTRKAS